MVIGTFWKEKGAAGPGIKFASKKILPNRRGAAGLRIAANAVGPGGSLSLPVILSTISASLITAAVLCRVMRVPGRTATLIGVGSSICGGSAIAATAPVIKADDQEVAHAISVVFLFNVLAALIFPTLGDVIGLSNNGFRAVRGHRGQRHVVGDRRRCRVGRHAPWRERARLRHHRQAHAHARHHPHHVRACAVGFRAQRKQAAENGADAASTSNFSLKRALPTFIVLFVCASLVATGASAVGVDPAVFAPLKTLSKFFIVVAMAAIGLNTDVVGLVKSGAKPIVLGAACWVAIACTSLAAQHMLGLW